MSYRPRRREPPQFFIDRALGRSAIADRLRKAGETVHVHDDHFKSDEDDEVWIRDVAARGWIILSKDKEIRKRPNERT